MFNSFFTIHHFIPSTTHPSIYVSNINLYMILYIFVDDGIACNVKINKIAHIFGEMKGNFSITKTYV